MVRPLGSSRQGSWRLETFDRLGSTNDLCIARAQAGEEPGLAVLAYAQTGGRGSRGRSWTEPPSGNLALTALMRPDPAIGAGCWPFVAGLALQDGLAAVSPARTRLKWPNDLMLGGRKLAGILIERGFEGADIWMAIGFGANLAATPPDLDRPVACLAEAGPAPDPETAARAVLAALDVWSGVLERDGFEPVRSAWLDRAHPVGTILRITSGVEAALARGAEHAQREGSFRGIAADGALLVLVDGREERVETGEVLMLDGRR